MDKVVAYIADTDPTAGELLETVQQAQVDLYTQLPQVTYELHTRFQGKVNSLKTELNQTATELTEIIEAAQSLEEENQKLMKDKKAGITYGSREVEELRAEMESLQEENKQFLEALIKKSKDTANRVLGSSPPTRQSEPPKPKVSPPARGRSSYNPASREPSTRKLALKQLKDTIEEIYNSKARFDNHCRETKASMETLSQHLQTFLNQKYGLRGLIVEWDAAIHAAVEKY